MLRFLRHFFRRPAVYVAGTLGGRPLTAHQQAAAVRAALAREVSDLGARAVIQKLEAEAAWWQAWATQEDIVKAGMGSYYAGGAAALADVLSDLRRWAEEPAPEPAADA